MSRTATTPNGLLWEWNDNDNPGAGTKGVTKASGGTGLNSCWSTLDVSVGTEHNANGTHKNDKITGANLNANVVDGLTLEVSAGSGTKVIQIKNAGVTMAKIAQAGATTGQAITWNGSAWAPGSPTAVIPDGYITRAKFATYFISTLVDLDARKAGTAAGNTPAAETVWNETSTTLVDKIQFHVIKSSQAKWLRFLFYLKSNALLDVADWTFTVTDGVTPITYSNSTNSGLWNLASALMDISGYTDWAWLTCTLAIKTSTGTCQMKKCVYALLPT